MTPCAARMTVFMGIRLIARLAQRHGCRYIQLVCSASAATLEQRYSQRSQTGERHPRRTQSESLEVTVSRLLAGRWDALDLPGKDMGDNRGMHPSRRLSRWVDGAAPAAFAGDRPGRQAVLRCAHRRPALWAAPTITSTTR